MPVPHIHALGIDIPSTPFVQSLQRVFFVALAFGFIGLFSRTAFAVTFLSGLYLFGMRQSFGFVEPAEGHFFIMFGIFAMSSHWLAANLSLGQVLAIGALALELLSPLALFSRRAQTSRASSSCRWDSQ